MLLVFDENEITFRSRVNAGDAAYFYRAVSNQARANRFGNLAQREWCPAIFPEGHGTHFIAGEPRYESERE